MVAPEAAASAPQVESAGAAPIESIPVDKSTVQPAPPPPPEAVDLPWHRLEFVEGTSRKFWQIRREGTDVVIAFGRIGTTGQSQRKPFVDGERAQAEIEKLVAEKLRKGYLEA